MHKSDQTAPERILELEGQLADWVTRAGQYQIDSIQMRNVARCASEALFQSWGGFEYEYDEDHTQVPPIVAHIYEYYSDYSKFEECPHSTLGELMRGKKVTLAKYNQE
jgi:hypothetical protein